MTCLMTVHLGVYALGAADDDERLLVEAHLPGCPQCRTELARLAPLPELLARVPAEMLPDPIPRDRPGRAWRAATVAAMTAAAAGVAAGFWLAPRTAQPAPATLTLSAANPATNVQATAALTATSWGTSIQLRVRGLPLNQPCRLIVRSRAGAREVTGSWDAWRDGPVTVPASAAWRPSDITTLQVATKTRTLVTITAPRAPHSQPAPTHQPGRTP
jgi:Putative zinc-finger